MVMPPIVGVVLGSLRSFKGRPAITGKEGMIGEVGTVRSPVGTRSEGWVFVHGERWRATLAFAPEEAYPEDSEPVLEVGHRAAVVGFGDRGVLQVVPVELPSRRSDLGPRD
jgi:membrane protein implicated in regulation of membrane protease activity